MTRPVPDLFGSLGDRYRVERELGRGGMAVVVSLFLCSALSPLGWEGRPGLDGGRQKEEAPRV